MQADPIEPAKRNDADRKPREEGDRKPRDRKPREEGDRKPREEGDRKPREEGDRKPRERKPRGEDGEDGKPREKKERKPRFVPPENWRAEAEAGVTLDSKIPTLGDSERLQRPNYNKLKADLDQADADMDKLYRKIDALKEDAKTVRNAQKDKNSTVFDELKKLNEERRTHSAVLTDNKHLKAEYTNKINAIDDALRNAEKKSGGAKPMRKKELTDLIKQKEDEFNNTKKTSAEEKKMSDEINKLKAMIKGIPELEKLKDERQKLNDQLRELGKKNKAEYEKVQVVSDRITELRSRLDEAGAKSKAEREAEKAEAGEKVEKAEGEKRPPRVLSDAEQAIENQRQAEYDAIKLLKDKKQKLRDKYDNEWLEYEKQQHELDKIYHMTKVQKNLKREEREKKWKEEDEKARLAEEEKAKAGLLFKYQGEIDLCDQLASHLEDLKPDKKSNKAFVAQSEITSHNVDADQLKQENLVYVKPKKFDETEVVNKKKGKQGKKQQKKETPAPVSESDKINIHFDTLHLFSELKVAPPTTLGQIDSVVKQLNEKKEYYLQLRAKEVENAGNQAEGEKKESKEGEAPAEEQQQQARESRNARPQKKDLKEDDFPEL